jgi:large subunit ribosomal protein L6
MSRIGMKPIILPAAVTVTQAGNSVQVKGAKGDLSTVIPPGISVSVEAGKVTVTRRGNAIQTKAYHGLLRSLINNLVIGVSTGFQKKLELVGTGYRAKSQGQGLSMAVGYSHPVEFPAPPGITLTTEGDTVVIVSGIDKQLVGEVAAKIRAVRPPEPYKGKGIHYQGEYIRRKAGKAAKVGTSS